MIPNEQHAPLGRKPSPLGTVFMIFTSVIGVVLCVYILLPTIAEYWFLLQGMPRDLLEDQQGRWYSEATFWLLIIITIAMFMLSGIIWAYLSVKSEIALKLVAWIGAWLIAIVGLCFWLIAITGSFYSQYSSLIYMNLLFVILICFHILPSVIWVAITARILTPLQVMSIIPMQTKRMIAFVGFLLIIPLIIRSLTLLFALPGVLMTERLVSIICFTWLCFLGLQILCYVAIGRFFSLSSSRRVTKVQ